MLASRGTTPLRLLAAGNHVTARVLGARVVQRANLRWTRGPKPVIDDIDFGPRSGAQEDHATAVAAFGLAVLKNLKGKALPDAIVALYILANEIKELPGFGDYHNKYLANELGRLQERLQTLHAVAEAEPLYAAGELGSMIDDYLRIRNLVPGTKFERKEAIRPPDYKGGGKLEKEGKAAISGVLDKLETKGDTPFGDIEGALKEALSKLHDYITTRQPMPSEADLVKIAAQHFHSFMQISPALYPFARQILDAWVTYMFTTWGPTGIVKDAKAFAEAVFKACTVHFDEPATPEAPQKREDVWGKSDKGYFPLGWDDAMVETEPGDVFKEWDPRSISRAQTITLLNRAAEQGLIAANQAIQYIIDHPDEMDELLDNLALTLIELPSGRIYWRLRGG